ncbi:rhodopsin-like [Exaiptasia diaphana]|uniref:G-protein coupled receptors family 1 profile domain-containing protein n=1 Tax=Exaiptasia diaphana TaxID=2652724 RepID=A0A913XEM7_EXADI|nr:rhodopsin-like [Exaiptasia diaphana]
MKTSLNYIILNLAILDAITGFLAIFCTLSKDVEGDLAAPMLEQAYNKSSIAAEVVCKIEAAFWLGSSISPFLLIGMAYERYKAIVHPLSRLHGIAIQKVVKILCFSWIGGFIYFIVDLAVVKYDSTKSSCVVVSNSWFNNQAYHIGLLISFYIIPFIVILFLYLRIIIALRRQDKQILGTQRAEAQTARTRTRNRGIVVVLMATIIFCICVCIPQGLYLASVIVKTLFNPSEIRLFHDIYVTLVAFNCAFNPFVYFIFIKSFRDGFKIAFKLKQNDGNTVCNLNKVKISQVAASRINAQTAHNEFQPQQLDSNCLPNV